MGRASHVNVVHRDLGGGHGGIVGSRTALPFDNTVCMTASLCNLPSTVIYAIVMRSHRLLQPTAAQWGSNTPSPLVPLARGHD